MRLSVSELIISLLHKKRFCATKGYLALSGLKKIRLFQAFGSCSLLGPSIEHGPKNGHEDYQISFLQLSGIGPCQASTKLGLGPLLLPTAGIKPGLPV